MEGYDHKPGQNLTLDALDPVVLEVHGGALTFEGKPVTAGGAKIACSAVDGAKAH